jgi:AcrR family transcriptional regulator
MRPMSPAEPASARRGAIVRAATLLFSRYGFRKTSMDLIAREAQVAKPTLYAHFADKDALFAAVCEELLRSILAEAQAARALPEVVDRVAAVLAAKFTRLHELVESSPHAAELLQASSERARRAIEATDAAYGELLASTLRAAARCGELDLAALGARPPALARALLQLGHGASYGARNVDEQRANLRALVGGYLRAGLLIKNALPSDGRPSGRRTG